MKNSTTSKQSLTSKVTQAVKSVVSSFDSIIEPKRYINNDGTIAKNHNTYKEFKQDLIKSSGFGW